MTKQVLAASTLFSVTFVFGLLMISLYSLVLIPTVHAGVCLDKDLGVCVDTPSMDTCPGGYLGPASATTAAICLPGGCCCYTQGVIPQGIPIVLTSACKDPTYPLGQVWISPTGEHSQEYCTSACASFYTGSNFTIPDASLTFGNRTGDSSFGRTIPSSGTLTGNGIPVGDAGTTTNTSAGSNTSLIANISTDADTNRSVALNGTDTDGQTLGQTAQNASHIIPYFVNAHITELSIRSLTGPDINSTILSFTLNNSRNALFRYTSDALAAFGIAQPAKHLTSVLYHDSLSGAPDIRMDVENASTQFLGADTYSVVTNAETQGVSLLSAEFNDTPQYRPMGIPAYVTVSHITARSFIGDGDKRMILGFTVNGDEPLHMTLTHDPKKLSTMLLTAATSVSYELYSGAQKVSEGQLSGPIDLALKPGVYTLHVFSSHEGYELIDLAVATTVPIDCVQYAAGQCGSDGNNYDDVCAAPGIQSRLYCANLTTPQNTTTEPKTADSHPIVYHSSAVIKAISIRSFIGSGSNQSLIGFGLKSAQDVTFSYFGKQLKGFGISETADGLSSTLLTSATDALNISADRPYALDSSSYLLNTQSTKQGVGMVHLDLACNGCSFDDGLSKLMVQSFVGDGDKRMIIGIEAEGDDEVGFTINNLASGLNDSLPAATDLAWELYDSDGRLITGSNLTDSASFSMNAGTYMLHIFSSTGGYAKLGLTFDKQFTYQCSSMGYSVCGLDGNMYVDACAMNDFQSSDKCGKNAICNDTDGGTNYGVAGQVSAMRHDECFTTDAGRPGLWKPTDSCTGQGCNLEEYSCLPDGWALDMVGCANGCNNGACTDGKLADSWLIDMALYTPDSGYSSGENMSLVRGQPIVILYDYASLKSVVRPSSLTVTLNGNSINVSAECDSPYDTRRGYSIVSCRASIGTYYFKNGQLNANVSVNGQVSFSDWYVNISEADFSSCQEVLPGWNDESKHRLNVVFNLFNYPNTTSEQLRRMALNLIDVNGTQHGLLSVAPFKSQAHKFNFWFIDHSQDMANCRTDNTTADCNQHAAVCPYNDQKVFAIVNDTRAFQYASPDFAQLSITQTYDGDNYDRLVTHDMGEFLGLSEEYGIDSFNYTYGTRLGDNCYGMENGTVESCAANAPWASLLTCKENASSCADVNESNLQQLGCYLGCGWYGSGAFRSTSDNIMRGYWNDPFSFGQWNEYLLTQKLNVFEK